MVKFFTRLKTALTPLTRVYIYLAFIGLGIPLTVTSGINFIYWALGISVIAGFIELFVLRFKNMLTPVILTLQLAWVLYLSISFYTETYSYSTDLVSYFIPTTFLLFSLLQFFATITICYWLAQGKFWVNLLGSYFLYNVSFILIFMFTQSILDSSMDIILLMLGSVAVSLCFLFIRTIFPLYPSVLTEQLQNVDKLVDSNYINSFDKTLCEYSFQYDKRYVILASHGRLLIILPIRPHYSISFSENVLGLDGKNVTPILEEVLQNSNRIRKDLHFSKKHTTALIVVTKPPKNLSEKALTSISVKRLNRSHITLGNVVLTTRKGVEHLVSFLSSENVTHFKKRQERKLKSFR